MREPRDRDQEKFAGSSFNQEPRVEDFPKPTIPPGYTLKKPDTSRRHSHAEETRPYDRKKRKGKGAG